MNFDLTKWIGNLTYLDIAVALTALISLFISVYELVSRKLKERTKVSAFVDYNAGFDLFHMCSGNNDFLFSVPCLFVNNADSDISITKIEFILKDKTTIECLQREESFYTYSNPVPYGPVAKSIHFPINLARMQGTYGVLRFDLPLTGDLSEISNVLFHTNKKTVHSKRFAKDMSSAISKLINQGNDFNNHKYNSCKNEAAESN